MNKISASYIDIKFQYFIKQPSLYICSSFQFRLAARITDLAFISTLVLARGIKFRLCRPTGDMLSMAAVVPGKCCLFLRVSGISITIVVTIKRQDCEFSNL